jgi:hypothetical protein
MESLLAVSIIPGAGLTDTATSSSVVALVGHAKRIVALTDRRDRHTLETSICVIIENRWSFVVSFVVGCEAYDFSSGSLVWLLGWFRVVLAEVGC